MAANQGRSTESPAEGDPDLPPANPGSPRKGAPQTGSSEEDAAPPPAPGDQAPAGTPGTGEGICPVCQGSGKIDGAACDNCNGNGHVIQGIGGA